VRRRLVIAIAGVAIAAVVLLALPLAVVLGRIYRDEELLRLQRDTVASTAGIDVDPAQRDPIELPRTSDELAVYDRAGRLRAGRGPATAPPLVRRALARGRVTDAAGHGVLEVAVPLLHAERVTGAVRAVRSDDAAAADARGAWLVLGAVAAAIIGLAALAAALLARRLATPLERLAVSARRLGEGDFSARAAPANIPEVDAAGAALATTAQRLEDLIARERAFTADASHQLRTPLQALRIELEAIELRGDAAPELPAALAEVDRLQATIETLLSVARDAPRDRPATDLGPLLAQARERWSGPLAQQARPLRIVERAAAPVARASADVVGEILDVLVSNAVEHGAGPVTITLRDTGDWLAIDVADEGDGIAPETGDVFARGVGGGHGIGLALARSLADADGARLALARPGPGPVFTLTLPAAAPASR
jgi:signal transduction histidine kinase